MRVRDVITACEDGAERIVGIDERAAVVIHRCGLGETAEEIAAVYAQHPEAGRVTGYQMPYTVVVERDGTVSQALRLGDYGPHARAWSTMAIGVAVVGDFRKHPPTQAQYDSLLAVAHIFSGWVGGADRVLGHDELDGGSHDPDKQCPGIGLDMHRLRHDVRLADLSRVVCAGFRR